MFFRMKSLDHVVLRVADVPACIAFYCDVLGGTLEHEYPDVGLSQVRAGDFIIDLLDINGSVGREGGGAPGADGHNLDHFCIRIEPFDEAELRAHFAKHGIETGRLLNNWGGDGIGPSFYIRDPAGNRVELKGPPVEPYLP